MVEPSDLTWPPDLDGHVPPRPAPANPGDRSRTAADDPLFAAGLPHAPEPAWSQPAVGPGREPTGAPRPGGYPGTPLEMEAGGHAAAPPAEPPGVYAAAPPAEAPGVYAAAPPAVAPGVYAVAPPAEPPGVYAVSPPAPAEVVDPRAPTPRQHPFTPTADEFARRRANRPAEPVAQRGARAVLRRATFGLVRPAPGPKELEYRNDVDMIRRNFGGLRQVTVVNPKGGAGKTVAALLLAMAFGQQRGGYVLAWDNNETQGTLGMRAQQDYHSRTVRDLLHDLPHFVGANGRVGDLSQYVRAQGEGMFDVLASDESATAGEMLTASAFGRLREVVSRFYKLIMVDTGNNVRAENWQAAIDATDQLVVTMSARNDSAETAARMLDHLEQTGRQRLVRQAVTVVSLPPSRKEIDLPAIRRHFAARTRVVLLAPYERLIDTGEPLRYSQLSVATHRAWLKIAAAVAGGL